MKLTQKPLPELLVAIAADSGSSRELSEYPCHAAVSQLKVLLSGSRSVQGRQPQDFLSLQITVLRLTITIRPQFGVDEMDAHGSVSQLSCWTRSFLRKTVRPSSPRSQTTRSLSHSVQEP